MASASASHRILVVAALGNPLATNWILGLQGMGCQVAVLDSRMRDVAASDLTDWGLNGKVSLVRPARREVTALRRAVRQVLQDDPDIVFGWWGSPVLQPLKAARHAFPLSKAVVCVDTLPNASNPLTEAREILRFHLASSWVDAYIFYSEKMRESFWSRIPRSRGRPYLSIVEPFPKQTFASVSSARPVHSLTRFDDRPHVIFTGRGDHLWSTQLRSLKDALGPFLTALADQGIHVFLPHGSDTRGHRFLHHYPAFTNDELRWGAFSKYLSEFDLHLVIYNEHNSTIRRRVSCGLSTRYALALTAEAPIAVTNTSTFVDDHWCDGPLGFKFSSIKDLRDKLDDRNMLEQCRQALRGAVNRFSFEARSDDIVSFFRAVVAR